MMDDSPAAQEDAWNTLGREINASVGSITNHNVKSVSAMLLRHNLIRGRGLLVQSVMGAHARRSDQTMALASCVAVINSKLPCVGELLTNRLLKRFLDHLARQRQGLTNAAEIALDLIVHLAIQGVVDYPVVIELLSLLVDPDDSGAIPPAGVGLAVDMARSSMAYLESVPLEGGVTLLHFTLEMFREMYQTDAVKGVVRRNIEKLLDEVQSANLTHVIPPALHLVDPSAAPDPLDISVGDDLECRHDLDRFMVDPHYVSHEEAYRAFADRAIPMVEAPPSPTTMRAPVGHFTRLATRPRSTRPARAGVTAPTTAWDRPAFMQLVYETVQGSMSEKEVATKIFDVMRRHSEVADLHTMAKVIIAAIARHVRTAQNGYRRFDGHLTIALTSIADSINRSTVGHVIKAALIEYYREANEALLAADDDTEDRALPFGSNASEPACLTRWLAANTVDIGTLPAPLTIGDLIGEIDLSVEDFMEDCKMPLRVFYTKLIAALCDAHGEALGRALVAGVTSDRLPRLMPWPAVDPLPLAFLQVVMTGHPTVWGIVHEGLPLTKPDGGGDGATSDDEYTYDYDTVTDSEAEARRLEGKRPAPPPPQEVNPDVGYVHPSRR